MNGHGQSRRMNGQSRRMNGHGQSRMMSGQSRLAIGRHKKYAALLVTYTLLKISVDSPCLGWLACRELCGLQT